MCPTGYKTPAAIGSAAVLYTSAHNWNPLTLDALL
jgi:hypothetical protein